MSNDNIERVLLLWGFTILEVLLPANWCLIKSTACLIQLAALTFNYLLKRVKVRIIVMVELLFGRLGNFLRLGRHL